MQNKKSFFSWLFGLKEKSQSSSTSKSPQARVWAVKPFDSHIFSKVVTYNKPDAGPFGCVLGPFRSEVDCEEFCDHSNISANNIFNIKTYSPIKTNKPNAKSK